VSTTEAEVAGVGDHPGPAGRAGRPGRRVSRALDRHPRAQLGGLLGGPLVWLLVVYIGSLVSLLLTSLYTTNDFTGNLVKTVSLTNFRQLLSDPTFRTVTIRTIGIALAVTVIDLALALPIAFFMAKVASRRTRRALAVAIVLPLWASYLVKAYSWRVILDPVGGVLKQTTGSSPGFGVVATVLVLAYLWMPYMALPIYAGLEKLPNSLLDASGDLGAKGGRTFRSVVLPMLTPSIAAGAIFTFSLSLGDYITVQIVGGKAETIGNVIYQDFGAGNLPQAAALAVVPVVIMTVVLLGIRRTGALENL
jgi:ABC-type spermidine/putrescine transport system permease subunit I